AWPIDRAGGYPVHPYLSASAPRSDSVTFAAVLQVRRADESAVSVRIHSSNGATSMIWIADTAQAKQPQISAWFVPTHLVSPDQPHGSFVDQDAVPEPSEFNLAGATAVLTWRENSL